MTGIFHSVDLIVKGEASGHRAECRSSLNPFLTLAVGAEPIYDTWLIPFESDGYTVFDTYTFNHTFQQSKSALHTYTIHYAVYRQYAKLTDVATTNGVGELVACSVHSAGPWTGTHSVTNTAPMSDPCILPQGSYWIAWHVELTGGGLGESLTISTVDGINCATSFNTWVNHSHLVGKTTTTGTFPPLLTTAGIGNFTAIAPTFASPADAFWAAIFDSRDAYP